MRWTFSKSFAYHMKNLPLALRVREKNWARFVGKCNHACVSESTKLGLSWSDYKFVSRELRKNRSFWILAVMAVGESIKFPDPSLGSVTAETQQPDFFQHLEIEPSVKQARNILGRYTKFPMSFNTNSRIVDTITLRTPIDWLVSTMHLFRSLLTTVQTANVERPLLR